MTPEGFVILLAIAAFLWGIYKIYEAFSDAKTYRSGYDNCQKQLSQKTQEYRQTISEQQQVQEKLQSEIKETCRNLENAESILKEKTQCFPWIARAIAHYETLKYFDVAEFLRTKKHPAGKAAEQVKEIAHECNKLRQEYHIARSRVEYYEELFPWLEEYIDTDIDEIIELAKEPPTELTKTDPVSRYLAKGEYEKLNVTERNQLALDRYLQRKKSNWEIGRDYERYIGYLYEKNGYQVEYTGIEKGFSDLGRDLIAIKDNEILIIQCKYWSRSKTIHEKHIAQLFGTTIKYKIDHNKDPKGVFVTSTNLSDMAKSFAKVLNIEIQENIPLEKYPIIKCNVSYDREWGGQEKIYHLPFDQQYDSTKITKSGEYFAFTVAEAESLGFRRAKKWYGNT